MIRNAQMGGQAESAANVVGFDAAAEPALLMSVPCLLINPLSFTTSRGRLAEHATNLARAHGIEVIRAADAAEISAATDRLVAGRQAIVIVLAGDGTVQAIAERLAALPAGVARPQLMVLGGGRSNLVAAELGGRGAVLAKLETALRRCREGAALQVEVLHLLRTEQPPAPARHGFFLAAGIVDYAIRACHRDRRNGRGRLAQGGAGTAWSLLGVALPALLGGRKPLIDELNVDVPGQPALMQPARLLIATTLQKPYGYLDPFAHRGRGAVRFTAVAAHGMAFWGRLPWIATGRFTTGMDAAHGYLSGRCDALRVQGLSSYALDGEKFHADPARPVMIRQGPALSFLTP